MIYTGSITRFVLVYYVTSLKIYYILCIYIIYIYFNTIFNFDLSSIICDGEEYSSINFFNDRDVRLND